MNGVFKLEGWKSKKIDDTGFLRCPYCKYCTEGILVDQDNNVECPKCKRKFSANKMEKTTLKKPVVICKSCESEVSLTPININSIGGYSYICPKCGNIIAIKFKNYVINSKTPLKLDWNKNVKRRVKGVNEKISFLLCKTNKDILVLKIMQLMAKKEKTGFLYFREEINKAGLFIDLKEKKYIGFIVWTENKNAALRQIYIVKDERKKGYATSLLKFWVENFADKVSNLFVVESPNKKTQKLLIKLGYARIENKHLKGIKCRFVKSAF